MEIKFKKSLFDTMSFLTKNSMKILNFKNLIILLLPKKILKRIMWFY